MCVNVRGKTCCIFLFAAAVLLNLTTAVVTNEDTYSLAEDEEVHVISSAHGRPTTTPPSRLDDDLTTAASFLDAIIAVFNGTNSSPKNVTAAADKSLFDSGDSDENQPRNLASWLRDSLIGRRWRRRQVPQKPSFPSFLLPANPYMPPASGRPPGHFAPPPHPGYSANGT